MSLRRSLVVSLSLATIAGVPLAPRTAHTAGSLPTVVGFLKAEACAQKQLTVILQAPTAAAVSGTIGEVGSSLAPTAFNLTAGGKSSVVVSVLEANCSGTVVPTRTLRITVPGVTPKDLTVVPERVTLKLPGATTGAASPLKLTEAEGRLECGSGKLQAEVAWKTGALAPANTVLKATVDTAAQPKPLTLSPNSAGKLQLPFPVVANPCSQAHNVSITSADLPGPATLVPSQVSFKQAP
jgi:hypothetical protein